MMQTQSTSLDRRMLLVRIPMSKPIVVDSLVVNAAIDAIAWATGTISACLAIADVQTREIDPLRRI